jgi:hypothetical protein
MFSLPPPLSITIDEADLEKVDKFEKMEKKKRTLIRILFA